MKKIAIFLIPIFALTAFAIQSNSAVQQKFTCQQMLDRCLEKGKKSKKACQKKFKRCKKNQGKTKKSHKKTTHKKKKKNKAKKNNK